MPREGICNKSLKRRRRTRTRRRRRRRRRRRQRRRDATAVIKGKGVRVRVRVRGVSPELGQRERRWWCGSEGSFVRLRRCVMVMPHAAGGEAWRGRN